MNMFEKNMNINLNFTFSVYSNMPCQRRLFYIFFPFVSSTVPLDLDAKMKALMFAAAFQVVSTIKTYELCNMIYQFLQISCLFLSQIERLLIYWGYPTCI